MLDYACWLWRSVVCLKWPETKTQNQTVHIPTLPKNYPFGGIFESILHTVHEAYKFMTEYDDPPQ